MKTYSPEKAGMSSARLARIPAVMEQFVQDNQLPGILTLVQRKGRVVHYGAYGLMDIEAGKPMQKDALFRIYSMTKPIVSVALMMLYEEGRFSLNDPVAKFIPAFAKTKVYAGSAPLGLTLVDQNPAMTLHHLLTHTAGLSYGSFFDSPVEALYRESVPNLFLRDQPLEEVISQIAELPLLFQPGTQWRYSFATDVLGYVVQVISDMPLADFLQERIYKPLGMTDTAFSVPPEKRDRLAQIYGAEKLYDPVALRPEEVGLIRDVTTPTQCPSGGGGLISTLGDYLAFCTCLINGGSYPGGQLIGRKTLAWMTADHIPASLKPMNMGINQMDFGFGLGFRVVTSLGEARSLTSVGAYGWSGAANTDFWIDPAEEMIGIMMTQHMPLEPYPVQERFRILAYQAIVE